MEIQAKNLSASFYFILFFQMTPGICWKPKQKEWGKKHIYRILKGFNKQLHILDMK